MQTEADKIMEDLQILSIEDLRRIRVFISGMVIGYNKRQGEVDKGSDRGTVPQYSSE